MSKFLWIALIAAGAYLVYSGIVSVSVNTASLPAGGEAISKVTGGGAITEQGRMYIVKGKRIGQFFFVDNERQKMDLALEFVGTDSERLEKLLNDAKKPAALIPQAKLLLESLEKAKELSRTVSSEVLAAVAQNSQESFQLASLAINNLQTQEHALEEENDQLAVLSSSLAQEVGGLADIAPQVAGTSDEDSDEATEDPAMPQKPSNEEIPLKF